MKMTLTERIEALVKLGDHLQGEDDFLRAVMKRTLFHNPWFTLDNQEKAVRAIADYFLDRKKLERWLEPYDLPEPDHPKKVGIVMAGNLPLVGFHDLLCVFVAGHRSCIKLSEKDKYLLPYLLSVLKRIDERTAGYFEVVEKLTGFEAVIATGSNNSARYFEAYFGKYPHIIRRNRNAVGVLTGEESREELLALGEDIFEYFGLGCRNVAKVYVPEGYDFEPLMKALHEFRQIILHEKYKHNFDYHFAVYSINKMPFLNNGCIILTENNSLQSHIGGLYYEYFRDLEAVESELEQRKEEIQCVVSKPGLFRDAIPFGQAQHPELWDYADGVDTLAFLASLENDGK